MSVQKLGHAVAVETAHEEVKEALLVVVDALTVLELVEDVAAELELLVEVAELVLEDAVVELIVEEIVENVVGAVPVLLIVLEDELIADDELVVTTRLVDELVKLDSEVELDVVEELAEVLDTDPEGAAHPDTDASLPE